MDGPFCTSNVIVLKNEDDSQNHSQQGLANLKDHQRLMLKITQVLEDNQIPFKMLDECKL